MERPFRGRSSYTSVYLYIGKEYLFSFTVAFLFFFAIFFINQLLLLAEEILSKNVAFLDVALLVLYSLPAIITFTFPFSSLVGALMAAGRLSADNEILALRAAGISYRRLFLPFAAAGLIFSLVSFVAGDYFLPRGTIAFARLYRDILYSNPALELEPYSVHSYGDTILVTGDVSKDGVEDLLIIDSTDDGKKRIIVAEKAVLTKSGRQSGVVSLNLESVFGHAAARKRKMDYDFFTSRRMEYNILLQSMSFSIHSLTPREMGSIDVWREIQTKREALEERRELRTREDAKKRLELAHSYYEHSEHGGAKQLFDLSRRALSAESAYERPLYDRSLQIHLLEFHKKIAIPFGCLAFVFFAFPLGGIARKTGRSVGFGLGLIVSVVYWALLFAGQTLGLRMSMNPSLAMWLPNILIFSAGVILFYFRSQA